MELFFDGGTIMLDRLLDLVPYLVTRATHEIKKGIEPMLTVSNFNVHVVRPGDKYGLNNVLTCGSKALVEFYDSRYDFTPRGQFISRYNVETIRDSDNGLCLDGGIPAWNISASDMATVRKYINN